MVSHKLAAEAMQFRKDTQNGKGRDHATKINGGK